MYDVIVVGGGPGGISTLVWCQRLGLKTLLLERGPELGGQLAAVNNPIVDYLGIPAVNGRELRQRFVAHADELRCEYRCNVQVERFDLQARRLWTNIGEFESQSLVLALGSRDKQLRVPGEAETIARQEVYSASRDKEQFSGKNVVVVGGGDRAIEGALLLAEHGANVTVVHRSKRFRARSQYLNPVQQHPRIQLVTDSTVQTIVGKNRVEGVLVRQQDMDAAAEKWIPAEAVFVRIGVEPNSHQLQGQLNTDEDGYVLVNEYGETSIPHVYAVGDLCTRPLFSSVAGSVAQGMTVAKVISL